MKNETYRMHMLATLPLTEVIRPSKPKKGFKAKPKRVRRDEKRDRWSS